MTRKPRWGLIILGIVLFVVVIGVAVIGTIAYIGYKQFSVQTVTTDDPEAEFRRVEARFEGQAPMVELQPGNETGVIVHREARAGSKTELSSLCLLAYDPEEKKLARFTMPFWLVRLGGRRPFHFNVDNDVFSSRNLNLTAEDIERHGPGLIVRFEKDGKRAIVWVE